MRSDVCPFDEHSRMGPACLDRPHLKVSEMQIDGGRISAFAIRRRISAARLPRPTTARLAPCPRVDSARLRRLTAPPVRSAKPPQGPVASLPLHLDPVLLRPPHRHRPAVGSGGPRSSLFPQGGAVCSLRESNKPPLLPERFLGVWRCVERSAIPPGCTLESGCGTNDAERSPPRKWRGRHETRHQQHR